MYLTITSTAQNASDLGYLLHKHPGRAQSFDLPVGRAQVFYPESTDRQCTVALLLEVDPVGLVRGKKFSGDAFTLSQYVNDRPYAASSLLAVALGRVFRSALNGVCAARPELVEQPPPLQVHVPALPSRGGAELVERFFAPIGWTVDARTSVLDETMPEWGESRYVDLTLTGTMPLHHALSHLYVLLPVLDDAKHYWVGDDEVDKLVRTAGAWLSTHPERELIASRYLAHQRDLVTDVVDRLAALDETPPESVDAAADADADDVGGDDGNRPLSLARLRREAVLTELVGMGAASVLDLGCGEGVLLRELIKDAQFTSILGVDVSHRALARAEKLLAFERMPDSQRARITLLQSSLTYRDERFSGFDALVLMEVIEHLDLGRLPALERIVFGQARPRHAVVTTPNAEYNVRYPSLVSHGMRHPDHRFEWGRAEFRRWAQDVADRCGYDVRFAPIGVDDPEVGPPTQMAVFRRNAAEEARA